MDLARRALPPKRRRPKLYRARPTEAKGIGPRAVQPAVTRRPVQFRLRIARLPRNNPLPYWAKEFLDA